ncbi:hypothetical protein EDB92DRAFT_1860727, partial [Lactarius akahatsu]
MLFYKPLVSLITAIALASTVTASATPVRRNDGPQCNPQVQKLYCCTETGTLGSLDPVTKILGGLLGLNLDAVVAAGCVLNVLWYFLDCRIRSVS